jgi:hypothetical protein
MITKLKDLKYSTIKSPKAIYNCLDELKDAIFIENPNKNSLTILQTNSENHFYLGFNKELDSKDIIFVNHSAGTNTIDLTAKTIIIFRNLPLVNSFLKSWFENPHIVGLC